MIIVITVVMLLTLIPLAIFTQAVQQLPLARHDQDHESALARRRSRRRRLPQPAQPEQQLLDLQRDATPTPTATRRSPTGSRFPARATTTRRSATRRTRRRRRSTGRSTSRRRASRGNVIRTVKVGIRRQGFLDFLYMTDYEIVDPALSGESVDVQVTARGSATPHHRLRARTRRQLQHRVLDRPRRAERAGAHERRPVRVRQPDIQRRHRHVLQLAGEPERRRQHAVRRARHRAQPVGVHERAVVRTATTIRRAVADLPFPPANTAIRNPGRRRGRRNGVCTPGPTTITLHNSGNTGQMDVTSPLTKSTNAGCGPGTNLNLPANGVVYVQTVPTATSDPNHSACTGAACNGDVKRERHAGRPAHDRRAERHHHQGQHRCTTSTRAAPTCSG